MARLNTDTQRLTRRCFTLLLASIALFASVVSRASDAAQVRTTLASDASVSDADAFLRQVRKKLESDEERQAQYVFVETRREQRFDGDGKLTEQSVKVFESYPGLPGERRWRRLLEADGARTDAVELERQSQERRARVEAHFRTPPSSAGNGRSGDRRPGRNEERIEDAFRVFTFHLIGREQLDGHDTLVFALEPRRNAQVTTREGRIMRYFHGRAWVSASEHELVRLRAEALDDVSIGWGLLGRIHKGSMFTFDRRKLDDATWLPVRTTYSASARMLLVRRIRMGGSTDYSEYRRLPAHSVARYAPVTPTPPSPE